MLDLLSEALIMMVSGVAYLLSLILGGLVEIMVALSGGWDLGGLF